MKQTYIEGVHCPYCNAKNDSRTGVGHEEEPRPNDVSVCFQCGNIMLFNDDLSLRAATSADLDRLLNDEEAWEQITNIIKSIDRVKNNQP